MIEKLLSEAVKPFEALLTKQRCIVFLLCSLLLSPEFFDCLAALLDNSSVSVFLGAVVNAFSTIGVVPFGVLLIWVFYLSPRAIYWMFFAFNKREMNKQVKAVERLVSSSEKSVDFFVERYSEIVGAWKESKDTAEREVRFRLEYMEIISSISALSFLWAFLGSYGLVYAACSFVLVVLYALHAASKNVACYLTCIAPYKIAMAKVKALDS